MEVTARVLLHEIKGFAIAGEMNFMPVLLQIMPEVKGPRCMPEPFPADNKKEFHGNPAGMICLVLRIRVPGRFQAVAGVCSMYSSGDSGIMIPAIR
jgi:hypothetical protein